MRRRALTIGCLVAGLTLMVVSYFLFTAPWGATGVDNSNPTVGDVVVYQLTLQNAGPDAATGIGVSAPLPTPLLPLGAG